jgi:hypothetical protein
MEDLNNLFLKDHGDRVDDVPTEDQLPEFLTDVLGLGWQQCMSAAELAEVACRQTRQAKITSNLLRRTAL